jgi:plasmid stabilization system protein ParE
VTYAVIVQPEAEADINDAYRWYENREPGLGGEFLGEVSTAFSRLASNPLHYPELHGTARRGRVRRFPYIVIYIVRLDQIVILAVLHQRQNPRLGESRVRAVKPE